MKSKLATTINSLETEVYKNVENNIVQFQSQIKKMQMKGLYKSNEKFIKNMNKKGIMSAWNRSPAINAAVIAKTGRRFSRLSNMNPLNNLSNLPCQPSINHFLKIILANTNILSTFNF